MKGSWDAQTNTMTWSRSVNDDIEMKATYRLLNENEFVFSYKASDKNGKNYFRLEGTGTRSGRNK